ncbi:MAG: UDP-N-acetylglucosamine 2-epimerase (non-hydrolyzing) [Butyrivibrio sp.]|nr:UDP-N-acetylglucosamine 2-epimerase (non-hydrolyzing) [Butyrivibrio sp.]
MMKILLVFGTRPEAIKMCPLVLELRKHKEIDCKVCLTGQHREMLRQVMEAFEIQEDYNLDIMRKNQTLTTITADVLEKLESVLAEEKPDIVLVHGDTTTSFAAALAAFYKQIPVGHVEAGLRTGNIYSPYPEEMNRLITGRIATYHFAPTERNRNNLIKENIGQNIYVTGNTVIDAFKTTVRENYSFHDPVLHGINYTNHRVILVTAHRRENLGKPLQNICRAVKRLAECYDDIEVIYPVHLNPSVRETVFTILKGVDRINLIEPMDVLDMHNLIARCNMVLTDSGGLQEEAPSFGKPVLVMRTETERPEAVEAGTVKVVGVKEEDIFSAASLLLENADEYKLMAHAVNPYGDGHACERIVSVLQDKMQKIIMQ